MPLAPGITAAMGRLGTDLQYEPTYSVITNHFNADQAAIDKVNAVSADLSAMGKTLLNSDDIPDGEQAYEVIAEIRFHGQGFELRIPMPEGGLSLDNKAAVIDAFHAQHKADYGYAFDDSRVELYTVRVIATVKVRHHELDPLFKGQSG